MYYPVQIPYILSSPFSRAIHYREQVVEALLGFVICFWEMEPRSCEPVAVENVILADGCIDLVAHPDERRLMFVGMSRTAFDYSVELPSRSFGARLMPGAFHQLTGLPATAAMDRALPLGAVDSSFDPDAFFALPPEEAKDWLYGYIARLAQGRRPDTFTGLFDRLADCPPATAAELYRLLHFSPRQCQRLFERHYGYSPKLALSVLRFQKCLRLLTLDGAGPTEVLDSLSYYDQPHFIRDFKRNMGITPRELVARYGG